MRKTLPKSGFPDDCVDQVQRLQLTPPQAGCNGVIHLFDVLTLITIRLHSPKKLKSRSQLQESLQREGNGAPPLPVRLAMKFPQLWLEVSPDWAADTSLTQTVASVFLANHLAYHFEHAFGNVVGDVHQAWRR